MDHGSCQKSQISYRGSNIESKSVIETHIADIDRLRTLGTRGSKVGEGIGGLRSITSNRAAAAAAAAAAGIKATATISTTTLVTKAATASAKSSTAAIAAEGTASAAAEAATTITAGTHTGTSEAILAYLEHTTLPVITVELLDRIARIIGGLKDHNAGALGATILAKVNVGTDNATSAS